MSSLKRRKDAPLSTTSLRPIKKQKSPPTLPLLTYNYEEAENTALDTIFTRLFNKLTEANNHKKD